jgi:hypothetical protein
MCKIIYIDESGISPDQGYSVYVCLYIESKNRTYLNDKIIEIEKQIKISHTHWTEMPWKIRLKFVDKIKYLDFDVIATICKNPILPDILLKKVLIESTVIDSNIINIFIDGKKNKNYERELKGLLRNHGVKVYDLKIVDDKKEPLIRLSDFLAGLTRTYFNNDRDKNNIFYIFNLVKNKIKIKEIKTPQSN